MSADRRKDLVAAAVLIAIPTILFIDVLGGWNALYLRDIVSYYYPAKKLLREIVLGGEFPYWNPWFSAGQPLAANPEHEVFYPLTWLILLPSYDFALQLLPIVHLWIASLGMYALLRSMKTGRTAAVTAAIAFGIGGLTIATVNLFPILFSLAWLPFTCLFARRFMIGRTRRDGVLAALFLGLQLLVAEPVTALQSGLLLGLFAVWRGWNDGRFAGVIRRVIDVAVISIGALAVAAVQILPALDHVRDSVRSRGFDLATISQWSTPWQRVVEFVFPHVFGLSLPDSGVPYWGGPLYGSVNSPFYFSIYSGLAIAVFCGAGLLTRMRGSALFAVIAISSFVLALGSHTPLLGILHEAGLLRSFRYPEKFLLMGGFAAIVYAALAFDRMLRGDARLRRAALVLAGFTTAIAAMGAVLARTAVYPALMGSFIGSNLRPTGPMLAHARTSWIVATAIGAGLLLLLRHAAKPSRAWRVAFFALLVLDLTPLAVEIAPRVPASLYERTPLVVEQFRQSGDRSRLFHYAEWSVRSAVGRRYRYNHPDRYQVMWNGISPMLPAAWDIPTVLEEDFDKTALLPTDDFTRSMLELGTPNWVDTMAAMANVGYLAVWQDPDAAIARAGGVMRNVEPVRLVGPASNPRFFFAKRLVRIDGREDFVRRLREGADPREVAFVEETAFDPARGVVQSVRQTANSVALDVATDGQAFLVVSITPHKYWTVTIDGRPADAIVTNVGYQGVIVPSGRHRLVMRYRNPLIGLGAAISIAALIAAAVLARGARPIARS